MKRRKPSPVLLVLREELGEILLESCALGLTMLLVSLYTLQGNDRPLLLSLLPWLPLWALLYLAIAVLLVWRHHLPPKDNTAFVGMTVPYTFLALCALALFVCALTSFSLLPVLISSAVVAALFWLAEFLMLRHAAAQMNKLNLPGHHYYAMTITYDLKERPRSDAEFFQALEQCCMEDHSSLEYVTREQPALIRLDGVLCEVKVQTHYTKYGLPAYELKVTELE